MKCYNNYKYLIKILIMFFSKKYTVTFLNSKWEIVKLNVKLKSIPRRDEYIYMDSKYYDVLNVVHSLELNHKIFVLVEETKPKTNIKLGL